MEKMLKVDKSAVSPQASVWDWGGRVDWDGYVREDDPPPQVPSGPIPPHTQEREEGVTKLRYMQFREVLSSSADYGWRVEGIRIPSEAGVDTKTLRERDQLRAALLSYVQSSRDVARAMHQRLSALRTSLEASSWFFRHEIISVIDM